MWAPDYVTVEDLKGFSRITTTADDPLIGIAITAASRAVDDFTNRQFGRVDAPEERVYTAYLDHHVPDYPVWLDRGHWVVNIDDLTDATGLTVTMDGTEVTDYTLTPRNAVAKGKAWTRLVIPGPLWWPYHREVCVNVTASWGWSNVPVAVQQATLIQASRFFSRRNSPYGIAGSPDTGGELRLLSRVDPDVAVALRGYVRPRAVG